MNATSRLLVRVTLWAVAPALAFNFVSRTWLDDGLSDPVADIFLVVSPLLLALWLATGIWAVTGRLPRMPRVNVPGLARRRKEAAGH